jgi:KUP system potassium uptake protein
MVLRSGEHLLMAEARRAALPLADDDETEITRPLAVTALGALGVVYGDIGTSPLYAFKLSVHGAHGIAPTGDNVLGVLSLIVWSLILVVSIKYLLFVLQADNRGEGGIIALVALLNPWRVPAGSRRHILMLLGLFGAALLYGDGTITPAISVLSAVEGLKVAVPASERFVVPIAIAILLGLFVLQSRGTSRIGALFGPIMFVWFVTIGVLGLVQIADAPQVLAAAHPAYAVDFMAGNGFMGFIILGTVFLAVTGAEALYADMGHFGRDPIRLAWFTVALPGLLLNYFGQGALVLSNPAAVSHPFYGLAPGWSLYPLLLLATLATVIASQAVISGTFSLTRQAVQFSLLPRVRIIQTDPHHVGQIYIPAVNWLLMIATIGLIVGFQSSSNLGAAYGLAVSLDMVITTILAFFVALRWRWNLAAAAILASLFLIVDLAFLGSNLFKLAAGGWYPLTVAALIVIVIGVWRSGIAALGALTDDKRPLLEEFLDGLEKAPPPRLSGTAVFMTGNLSRVPTLLLHHLRHNQALHERILLVKVVVDDEPRVPTVDRVKVEALSSGFYRITVRYGFMQSPNIPVALRLCGRLGLDVDPTETTFYLGHEEIIATPQAPIWSSLRSRLFSAMWRNASRATAFYKIPADQVVAIGLHVEM